MQRRDSNTVDLSNETLRIADDVLVWPIRERGELVYRIEIPKLHRFFRVGPTEYSLISLLDGQTTLPQACGITASKLGGQAPTSAQAKSITRWLLSNEIAHLRSEPTPTRQQTTSRGFGKSDRPAMRLLGKLNPFWMKVPLSKGTQSTGHRYLQACTQWAVPLFALPPVLLGLMLIASAILGLSMNWSEFTQDSATLFHPYQWLSLFGTWLLLKLLHEWAHAVACVRHGGTVGESGLAFVLFAPLAYVDVTSCWRMPSRWARIAVSSAGMHVELIVAAIAFWGWMFVDAPIMQSLCRNTVFAAGFSTLLFNANVLMRFDGYFIFSDLIEVPNLASEASTWLRSFSKRIVAGDAMAPSEFCGWRRYIIATYGIAALAWRVLICVTLLIASSVMFSGAGIVLAAIGIVTWLYGPLLGLRQFYLDLKHGSPIRLARSLVVGPAAIAVFGGCLFWLPIPTSVQMPAVANYVPESIVRARVSGFIQSIYVAEGERVHRGEVIMQLANRELTIQAKKLELAKSVNEVRLRKAQDKHDSSDYHVLQENQLAITTQLEQLRRQTDALTVVASRDGHVIANDLTTLIGTHVEEGDVLLIVAAPKDKEVIAIVDQDRIEDVRLLEGRSISVRTASYRTFPARVDQIEPRATERLSEVALAATQGGPLLVRAADDDSGGDSGGDSLKLLQPHFRARIALSPEVAQQVPSGMRLRVLFGYRTSPIASRMSRWIQETWDTARDSAAAR